MPKLQNSLVCSRVILTPRGTNPKVFRLIRELLATPIPSLISLLASPNLSLRLIWVWQKESYQEGKLEGTIEILYFLIVQ